MGASLIGVTRLVIRDFDRVLDATGASALGGGGDGEYCILGYVWLIDSTLGGDHYPLGGDYSAHGGECSTFGDYCVSIGAASSLYFHHF